MIDAPRPSRNKSIIDTNIEYQVEPIDRNSTIRRVETVVGHRESIAVYKRIDMKQVDHSIPLVNLLEDEGDRWMRGCWNQIYVQSLQRSTLSLRPYVKAVSVTDLEIINCRFNPTTNDKKQTVMNSIA